MNLSMGKPTANGQMTMTVIGLDNSTEVQTEIIDPAVADIIFPDSKVPGTNMGPTWVLSAPDGPRVGHRNLVIIFLRMGTRIGG